MMLINLSTKFESLNDEKLSKLIAGLRSLIIELQTRDLPDSTIEVLNVEIEKINSLELSEPKLRRLSSIAQDTIIRVLEKKHKIVPNGYYKRYWMALGMVIYGLPFGLAISLPFGTIGLMAVGFPLGLAIGMAVGSDMDKKAKAEGRQLEFSVD